jgi:dUTP pyrophosphatase
MQSGIKTGDVVTGSLPIKVILLDVRAKPPQYQTSNAAGADLEAVFDGPPIELAPRSRQAVPTGIAIALPDGIEAQIRSRSGLAANHGISVLNSPGTIDSDFRGEIKVILYNASDVPFLIRSGDRIAQLIIAPVLKAEFESVDTLDETDRGALGFGSTGTN